MLDLHWLCKGLWTTFESMHIIREQSVGVMVCEGLVPQKSLYIAQILNGLLWN